MASLDHRGDARDQRFFGERAIGEGGIVGEIDEAGIGPRHPNLAEYGEAAEAGIEDEDAWGGGTGRIGHGAS